MPYLMKNGKWRAERQIHGKRYTKTCDTRRDALDWESGVDKRAAIEEVTQTVTALEWLNAYLDFARDRCVSIVYYQKKRCARILLENIGRDTPVTEIIPAHVLATMTIAARMWRAGTANLLRKHMSAAWKWGATYHGLPERNPFAVVQPFAADRKPRRVPTEAEFHAACAAATERDKRFLMACLHTAARKGELFRLRWNEVDFERGIILLGTRKRKGGGMEYDPIPMTKILRELLLEQRREGLNMEYVFCHVNGKPYTTRERLLKRICKRAEIAHFSLHGIRHLTASILAREGIPMQQIQHILRHKQLATTERYISQIAPLENVLEDVFGKRERLLPSEPEKPYLREVPHKNPLAYDDSIIIQ